ncbi:hypothetical protein [Gemmatimonas sp. UBA7669]|uniref:hypothetical protein n=1 Tax=Gemmatimonas sp. UBA7669 TaxID=1946568 RepID=UPI0025BF0DE8|nr:hypothetical protein [Gemmatimonas sp. UBA7669]
MAFEPTERLPITLTRLRDHGFAYQKPDSVMYTTPDGTRALGVLGVRELVIGVEDTATALVQWRQFLETPAQEKHGVLTFPRGPALRFVEAPTGGILEMAVRVRSLEHAERVLVDKGMLRKDGGHVMIAVPNAGGLRVRLVQ